MMIQWSVEFIVHCLHSLGVASLIHFLQIKLGLSFLYMNRNLRFVASIGFVESRLFFLLSPLRYNTFNLCSVIYCICLSWSTQWSAIFCMLQWYNRQRYCLLLYMPMSFDCGLWSLFVWLKHIQDFHNTIRVNLYVSLDLWCWIKNAS